MKGLVGHEEWGVSLKEFQRQLDEAIDAPGFSADAFVAVEVDSDLWLLDLASLSEASVLPVLSQTGRAPSWVLGIGSFRGQIHTVLDMCQVMKGKKTSMPQQAWATPLNERWPGGLALLWPQMLGLMAKPELELVPDATDVDRWELARWRDIKGQEWKEFDVKKFVFSEFAGVEPA